MSSPQNELIDPQTIARLVEASYALGGPPEVTFLRRGFNDHYRVDAGGAS